MYRLLGIALLLLLGLAGCGKKPLPDVSHFATEDMLRQRCQTLKLTCRLQWHNDVSSTPWDGNAYDNNNNWWFVWSDSKEGAIDKLYTTLGGKPTKPVDPRPQTIWEGAR